MKTNKVLIYSMLNNLIIALLKIIGSFSFNLGSLFADGMHTLSDFITDIVSIIGSKISKKKPTRYHPFGFGKVEYLTNLFIGIVLLLLGTFIIISSFFKKENIPNFNVFYLVLMCFFLKLIAIIIMYKEGTKNHNQLLLTSVAESKSDLYSSLGVMIVISLLQFSNKVEILKYSDLIGSIIIGIIVLKTSFSIIIHNCLSLIGEVEENEQLDLKVKELLAIEKDIKKLKTTYIQYGSYYKLQLSLVLDSNLSLRQVSNLEKRVKQTIIRHRSLNIRYVTIFVTNKLESI